jgi:hypothetical protein
VNVHVLLPHGEHPYNAFSLSGSSGVDVDVADGNAEDDEVLGDGNTALVGEGVGEGVLEGWVATGVMLADVAVALQRKF